MRIIVNHLTRMQRGFMCVAGLDVQTRKHVRPVMRGRLTVDFLRRRQGPFEMAHEVDIGAVEHTGKPPEVEDYRFDYRHALSLRALNPADFWKLLQQVARPRLSDIFGNELALTGVACSLPTGHGAASLGCIVPVGKPTLALLSRPERPDQVRITFSDGAMRVGTALTDIRFFGADHVTPEPALINQVNERIQSGSRVILSVGLSRPYAPSPSVAPRHWLQVNNIHLEDNPTWALG